MSRHDTSAKPDVDSSDVLEPPTLIDKDSGTLLRRALDSDPLSEDINDTGSEDTWPSLDRVDMPPRATKPVEPAASARTERVFVEESLPAEVQARSPSVSISPLTAYAPEAQIISHTPHRASSAQVPIDLASVLGVTGDPSFEANLEPTPPESAPVVPAAAAPQHILGTIKPISRLKKRTSHQPARNFGSRFSAQQIHRASSAMEALSKAIPFVIGTFAFLAILYFFVSFRQTDTQATPHVQIAVLDMPNGEIQALHIKLETYPSGLIVLQDKKVLGTTPFEATIAASTANDVISVHLQGPAFRSWLGQIRRSPDGAFHIHATLNKQ